MPREGSPSEETPEPETRKKGDTLERLGCFALQCIFFLMIAGGPVLNLAIPAFNGIQEKARQMQACNNARQIILALHAYAKDHEGKYPEGSTANEAFRELFRGGYVDDERIFSAQVSPFVPDNNFGIRPHFEDALSPGENHWAMTKGVRSQDNGDVPLIFENPARCTWPPEWDADIAGQAKPGRAWRGGKIIVGRNDGSVSTEKLTVAKGVAPLISIKEDKNLFELAGPHEILDVAR